MAGNFKTKESGSCLGVQLSVCEKFLTKKIRDPNPNTGMDSSS